MRLPWSRKQPPVYSFDESFSIAIVDLGQAFDAFTKTWQCPPDYYYHIIGFTIHVRCTSAGISRAPYFWTQRGGQIMFGITSNVLYQSTWEAYLSWSISPAYYDIGFPPTFSHDQLPAHLYMLPGDLFTFSIDNFQRADSLFFANLIMKEWKLR